ncbi:MAG TPA: hypothetical protein VMB50_01635 [Myxococcales bacterium]|nr:hypothetical protein [Myxococcales bacterium]
MRSTLSYLLVLASLGCGSSSKVPVDTCPTGDRCSIAWSLDAGPWTGTCPGSADVSTGFLAGGGAGSAVAASRFGPLGARLLLATTAAGGCALETGSQAPYGGAAADLQVTLAYGLGPGSYPVGPDAGGWVQAALQILWPCGGYSGAEVVGGNIDFTEVDPAQGLSGSYHFDLGLPGGGGSGGGQLPDGGSWSTTCDPLEDPIEEGTFEAPPCDFCPTPPLCGDAGCSAGEVCFRGCGGPGGRCVPAPTCIGAPACGNTNACTFDAGFDCRSPTDDEICNGFDGFSAFCNCSP